MSIQNTLQMFSIRRLIPATHFLLWLSAVLMGLSLPFSSPIFSHIGKFTNCQDARYSELNHPYPSATGPSPLSPDVWRGNNQQFFFAIDRSFYSPHFICSFFPFKSNKTCNSHDIPRLGQRTCRCSKPNKSIFSFCLAIWHLWFSSGPSLNRFKSSI